MFGSFTELAYDLMAATAARYNFITPNSHSPAQLVMSCVLLSSRIGM
jgi:hypothetical protein